MGKIKRFEDMEIWQKSVEIAVEVYRISEEGRLKTDFGMKDQIRRAAASISDNIAEGFEYDNNKDFIRFLRYSKGSSGELRNKLYILHKAGFLNQEYYENMYERLIDLSKNIAGLIKYLNEYELKKNQPPKINSQ